MLQNREVRDTRARGRAPLRIRTVRARRGEARRGGPRSGQGGRRGEGVCRGPGSDWDRNGRIDPLKRARNASRSRLAHSIQRWQRMRGIETSSAAAFPVPSPYELTTGRLVLLLLLAWPGLPAHHLLGSLRGSQRTLLCASLVALTRSSTLQRKTRAVVRCGRFHCSPAYLPCARDRGRKRAKDPDLDCADLDLLIFSKAGRGETAAARQRQEQGRVRRSQGQTRGEIERERDRERNEGEGERRTKSGSGSQFGVIGNCYCLFVNHRCRRAFERFSFFSLELVS